MAGTVQADIARKQRELASAVSRLRKLETDSCFDPNDATSRPTPDQQNVIDDFGIIKHQYVRGGNQSGKSQLSARLISWLFAESKPGWVRPKEWGTEPLLIIVMGRTTKQIEDTLWKKISGFLDPSTYHVQRIGGSIQKVTQKDTQNTILFLSHHSENEAREKVQSFVAHAVWLDEMPGSFKLIEELHRRCQARNGYFLASFTPKVINNEIKKLVDNARLPLAKSYKLRALDNPIYTEEKKGEIVQSLGTMTEAYRNTILEGDWLTSDEAVYMLDHDSMILPPPGYTASWRHVEAVDPALKSALGLTVWAEDPTNSKWYCIRSDYIKGIQDPRELILEVQRRTANYNIVRRIADPHEVWYIQMAAGMGIQPNYIGVWGKNTRKGELIKGLQDKLGTRIYLAPWCQDLVYEFEECRWSETAENKIVNASSFHLLDSAQYFADNIPTPIQAAPALPVHQVLYEAHIKRKQQKEKLMNSKVQRTRKW